jgi:hypothetical protein
LETPFTKTTCYQENVSAFCIVVDGHNEIIGENFIPEKKKFSIVPASL